MISLKRFYLFGLLLPLLVPLCIYGLVEMGWFDPKSGLIGLFVYGSVQFYGIPYAAFILVAIAWLWNKPIRTVSATLWFLPLAFIPVIYGYVLINAGPIHTNILFSLLVFSAVFSLWYGVCYISLIYLLAFILTRAGIVADHENRSDAN